MRIECMDKTNLEYEIKKWVRDLNKGESLKIEIKPCEVLKGTYDLKIRLSEQRSKK